MNRIIIADKYHDGTKFALGTNYIRIRNGIVEQVAGFTNQETLLKQFGEEYTIDDYRGKIVTPGIIDSHNHFTLTALKMKYETDFGSAKSFDEVGALILSSRPRGDEGWILGYNINEFNLSEERLPTAEDLDRVISDRPVFITHTTEHYAICNTVALQICGITRETEDPSGGLIGRYGNGTPNGVLYEPSAMDLAKHKIPVFSLEEYKIALEWASAEYRKKGITAVKDIGGTGGDIDEEKRVMALNEVSEQKKLRIRVGVALPIFSLEDMDRKVGISKRIRENDLLKFAGYKMFVDGSSLSRTAWMKKLWNKNFDEIDEGNYGGSLWNIGDFRQVVRKLSIEDTTISIHAIGDKAIAEAIQAIKEAKSSNGSRASFTLIHCYLPSNEDIRDLNDLGVSVETQTSFIFFSGHPIASNFGFERYRKLFPIRTMLDSGINVCNGSDSPVTTYDPLYGIVSAVTRNTKRELPAPSWNESGESIDLEKTIMTYTRNCAMALQWDMIGSLKQGSWGDFTVWDRIPEDFGKVNSQNFVYKVLLSGE